MREEVHMYFCTLFDVQYIEQGILLYQSMIKYTNHFTLYVIAFDLETEIILENQQYTNLVVIPYSQFETIELKRAKKNRTAREFFWTCSSYAIKYVIEQYNVPHCTYVDSDIYFYQSPIVLLREIIESGSDVGIISHGYGKYPEYEYIARLAGKYCVEFNTFFNNENGKKVLDWWCKQCLLLCTEKPDGIHFGDQKYIEEFAKRFNGIFEYNNKGAGIAPWNISRFVLDKEVIKDKDTKENIAIVFYHFHHLHFLSEHKADIEINVRPGKVDKRLVKMIYLPYIQEYTKVNEMLNTNYENFFYKKEYKCKQSTPRKIWDFLTCESSVYFLLRKIYRYLFRRRNDFISF